MAAPLLTLEVSHPWNDRTVLGAKVSGQIAKRAPLNGGARFGICGPARWSRAVSGEW